MSRLDNLTPFGHGSACVLGLDDCLYLVHCLAARFNMPTPGSAYDDRLKLSEQRTPPMADEHWGDPATTSLKVPGQAIVERPAAEVYVLGSAWTPHARPVTSMRVEARVGSCTGTVQVVGERVWSRGMAGLRASPPMPFTCVPLRYEHSFGGTITDAAGDVVAQELRNPIGVGLAISAADAIGRPLPMLETPDEPLTAWDGRVTPAGFGAIPGNWQPRRGLAGTYDAAWVADRAPLWPRDTAPGFFSAAAPGLTTPAPFRGGERVLLHGFAPEGSFEFSLPSYRVLAKHVYTDGVERRELACDGVLIEPDERALTMFWRCPAPLETGLRRLLATTIRLLEPWEVVA
jgi:hypothetical protein